MFPDIGSSTGFVLGMRDEPRRLLKMAKTKSRLDSRPSLHHFTSCPAAEAIYNDGEQNNYTDDKYLKERRYTGHVQCIRQQAENEHAEEGLHHVARTAGQRDTADNNRGD